MFNSLYESISIRNSQNVAQNSQAFVPTRYVRGAEPLKNLEVSPAIRYPLQTQTKRERIFHDLPQILINEVTCPVFETISAGHVGRSGSALKEGIENAKMLNLPSFSHMKTFPPKDLSELIIWLKANPNKASMAVPFLGGRLMATYMQQQIGTQCALIPYRGSAPALQGIVAGQLDLSFDFQITIESLFRAGDIKAYATTSDVRVMPDVPTFSEVGLPLLSYAGWLGVFAPARTPKAIIEKLNAAVIEASSDSVVQSKIEAFGGDIFPS